MFTSDLSVDELLCIESMGFDALGLVLGSSIYHIGWQRIRTNKNQELQVISRAMYDARRLAIHRMEQEAAVLDADGIVGVRMEITTRDWGPDLLEFMFLGTAVRARDPNQRMRPEHGVPFSSDLTGQDFYKLRVAGFRPVRLVIGSCVYHVSTNSVSQWFRQLSGSTEHVPLTTGTYAARELAMQRMEAECTQFGGGGVVAAQVHEKNHGWGSHVIEFFAIGTAVVRDPSARSVTAPALVLTTNA
ncbi:MAG: heavy metal-binding domain-containing protein [Acidimicrobiaceae bacterium]|nr:heavy metal-binding domain-containing protein [Acidimicrobiaceae bacterium]